MNITNIRWVRRWALRTGFDLAGFRIAVHILFLGHRTAVGGPRTVVGVLRIRLGNPPLRFRTDWHSKLALRRKTRRDIHQWRKSQRRLSHRNLWNILERIRKGEFLQNIVLDFFLRKSALPSLYRTPQSVLRSFRRRFRRHILHILVHHSLDHFRLLGRAERRTDGEHKLRRLKQG